MRVRGLFYGRRPEALRRALCFFVLLWAGLSSVANAQERQGEQQPERPPESEQRQAEDDEFETFLEEGLENKEEDGHGQGQASPATTQEEPAQPERDRAGAQDAGAPAARSPEMLETIPVDQPQPPRQTRVSGELENIVVTATKREANLRDIAGSVGAVRGEQLESMNAQSMEDYLKLVPGVTLPGGDSDESVPIIRGINVGGGISSPTGIFMDDMPFMAMRTPLAIPDINPFDLDRVEVLKGPQGTLFGGTALNGAIRYITRKPEHDVWGGKLRQTLSNTRFGGGEWRGFDQVSAGAVNVPLFGDALALRAVGIRRREGGLYDMRAPDDQGNDLRNESDADRAKQDHGRILASWIPPVENLDVSALYFFQNSARADDSRADNPDEPSSGDDVGRPFPSPRVHDFTGANLRVTYDFPWAQLLSTSNYFTQDNWIVGHDEANALGAAQDRQNQTEFFIIFADNVHGWTQELRLSSPRGGAGDWQWVLGLAYFDSDQDLWSWIYSGPDIEDPRYEHQVTQQQRNSNFFWGTIDTVGSEEALFGDLTWRPGEHWELSAGGRWFRNEMAAVTEVCGQVVIALAPPGPDTRPCFAEPGTLRASDFNPKVSLRYLPNRNLQFYALVAKGFQFGGFQLNPTGIGFEESAEQSGHTFGPFDSSTLWNYEGGIRTEWLDRRLRFDLTAFYVDWRDMQLFVNFPLGGDAGQIPQPDGGERSIFDSGLITNVGRASSKGFELSFAVIPFIGAQWVSNAAWVKAVTEEAFDHDNPDGPVPPGTPLPGTPRWQWSNMASYRHPLPFFPSWNIGATLTHVYLGKAPDNIRPTGTIFGYDSLDARVTLAPEDSRFQPELSFEVHNLTDVRGVTSHETFDRQDDGRTVEVFRFIRPRTMTLSLRLRF